MVEENDRLRLDVEMYQNELDQIERDKDAISGPEVLVGEIRHRLEEAREELLSMEHQIEEERSQKEEAWKEISQWKMVEFKFYNFTVV